MKRLRMFLVRVSLPAAAALLRVLPWPVVRRAGWGIGRLAHALQPRRRRRASEGLSRSLGLAEKELDRAVRRVFTGLGMNLAEIIWLASDRRRVGPLVRFQGLEHLQEAQARGRGVVMITGHLGSWELLAAAIVHGGIPIAIIAREASDGKVNEFLVGLRTRLGVRTVLRGSGGSAREILRTLRSGEVLGAIIDQDIRIDGTFVEFFGRPAYTPTGPVALALRAGSPVVLGCTWREPDGTHVVRFDPPVTLDAGSERVAAVHRYTAEFTAWLEARIREHPEQWVWIHRRWRRRPPD